MKHLFVSLIMLGIAGTTLAQETTVPDTSQTSGFSTLPGIQQAPRLFENKKPPRGTMPRSLTNYGEALAAYKKRLTKRKVPTRQDPADCSIIVWGDTTTTVPMPTLSPDASVDPNMPILKPNMRCVPPASIKPRPDSLLSPPQTLKRYPMKFPRK